MANPLESILGSGSELIKQLFSQVFGLTKAEKQQNEFNANEAQKARDFQKQLFDSGNYFNAMQAQKQMDFQANMANTQYQRGVADMQAAGLNPALAYGQGGASAMSGSMATAAAAPSAPAASGNGRGNNSSLSEILQSAGIALELKKKEKEISEIESKEFLNRMDAKAKETESAWNESRNEYQRLQIGVFDKVTDTTLRQMESVIRSNDARAALDKAGISVAEAESTLKTNQALLASIDAQTRGELNKLEMRYRVAQIAYEYSATSVNKKRLDEIQASTNELYQRALLHAANAGALDAQTQNYYLEHDILEYDKAEKKFTVDHLKADRFWQKAAMVTGMIRDIGSAVGQVYGAGAIGKFAGVGSNLSRFATPSQIIPASDYNRIYSAVQSTRR